ncbi:MAG TPA: hypothetical protein DDX29_06290 [Clostridiales bacterium]|nr:hypothetical protein [Clostridiales bacterium]
MINKLKLFFTIQIFRIVHFDMHDYRKTVFLAGSARSGTTWLQELVNFNNAYRVLFEPFRPDKVDLVKRWHQFQYLRVGENASVFMDPMIDILSGRIKDPWVDTSNRRLFSEKRIVKAIHANLFLFWMKKHFPEVPIVLIIRHPCAVANSKINIVRKHFQYTNNPLKAFLNQPQLMEDFLFPYESKMRDSKTDFESFVWMWCIENFIPIKQFNDGEIHITFYENLCINPEEEIKHIFSYINRPYSSEVIGKTRVPSSVSRKNSAINSGTDLLSSWRKHVSDDQIKSALDILNLFGMDNIYNDGDLPLLGSCEILNAL